MGNIEIQTEQNIIPAEPLPSRRVKRIKELLLPEAYRAWIAPLLPASFRVTHTYGVIGEGPIRWIEVMESKRDPTVPNHARIYLAPEETHVPTIILGDAGAVVHFAWVDRTVVYPPPEPGQELVVGSSRIRYPDDLIGLPGMDHLRNAQRKIMYAIRLSTFWPQDERILRMDGNVMKAKAYGHYARPVEVFFHLTPTDEWSDGHRFVLTNSESYVRAHPELDFLEMA